LFFFFNFGLVIFFNKNQTKLKMITPIMNYEVVFAVVLYWSNFKVFFILK
jgi:hypothetical protein